MIICTAFANGKHHDFWLFKESKVSALERALIDTDTGYFGICKIRENYVLPKKKTKKNPLSAEEKAFNRKIPSERVLNEHVIGLLKRFKLVSDCYRNRRKGFEVSVDDYITKPFTIYKKGDAVYKLMIVEDEPIIRKGIIHSVDWEQIGFVVCSDAENGKAAMQKMEEARPDVVLMDIRMPIMDGLELMSHMTKKYPEIELVVLSGYGDISYAQHAIACGVLGYILKPTKDQDIIDTFQRVKHHLDTREKFQEKTALISQKKLLDPALHLAIAYMEENHSQRITLEDVASVAFMNASYFSTYFKQKTGDSFIDFLTEIRMEKALELVKTTGYTVQQIAIHVGYSDYRYFSQLFRKIVGKNISQIRKEQRHGEASSKP